MKFYLLYGASEELEITGECQIGRRHGDLKFSDELLSGTHAKFLSDGEKLYVTDLGSSNGTFVNKKRIESSVPVELNNGDQVEMGAQKIKIKCFDNESTRIEESYTPGESTRIESPLHISEAEEAIPAIQIAQETAPSASEAPAISLIKDEIGPKTIVEPSPTPLNNEATHIEAISELTPPEGYHPKIPPQEVSEHTHVETIKEEAPVTSTPHLKIVENPFITPNHIKPARISRNTLPKNTAPTASLSPEPHPVVSATQEIEGVFGTKKIMIVSAVIIGVFAYLLTDGKNTERAIARIEEKKTEATQIHNEVSSSESTQPITKTESSTSIAETAQETQNSSASLQVASISENKVEASESSTSSSSSTEVKAKNKDKAKPKKKSKIAKKSAKTSETHLKSTKKDPYAEATLLKQLSKIREEAKRTKSQRVKAALEVDAIDVTAAHYKKFKTAILLKWKNNRGLASGEKNKLKKTLQGQIIALNNREKNVRANITPYINGKIETPFK